MLSERIFPTFPSEILPENASTLAYGPYGTIAIASGSLINFAFISNQEKSLNNINLKQIKPMFSISVGLNMVTALKFDTSKQLCADPILYIGDSAGNIFIYNYQKHEYLAVFSPNGHWKDDRYVNVQQIEIDYLPDLRLLNRSNGEKDNNEVAKIEQKNNKSGNVYKNKNIIVLFKSKKIVSYTIIQEDDNPEQTQDNNINLNNIQGMDDNLTIEIDNDSNNSNDSSEFNIGINRNNSSYNNSFYKSQVSNSLDSISSALNFTVNWVIDLESEMTNFSIDPFTNKKIFLYNKNKDNSFTIINLEEISGSFSSISSQTENSGEIHSHYVTPKISLSSSLNSYNFKSNNKVTTFDNTEIIIYPYSTIQCAQFSRHIQGYVYILTEHELMLYSIDLDLFTRVNLTNTTSQKSAHFEKIIQFETDHRKILLVYKTGVMALFSLSSLLGRNESNNLREMLPVNPKRRRSESDFKPSEANRRYSRLSDTSAEEGIRRQVQLKNEVQMVNKQHARDSNDVKIHHFNSNESLRNNFSFKAIFEVKQVVQSQQFISCSSPPFEADRDDLIVFLYHPFGIALFDMSRMRIVSCCPLFSDKTTCFSTNEKFVAYGSSQGNIRIRSIFDNSFFFSLHVLDDPIKFISISNKFANQQLSQENENGGLNGIHIYFGSDKKIGEFCFDTRKLSIYRSPNSFSIKRVIGSHTGGLIVQRDDTTAGVFIKSNEVFLSFPLNDKIIDFCLNENENKSEEQPENNSVGQDEKGSFMILRKNNIVELYKYNKYTKFSFTDNNYNCSNFNFLNDNDINNSSSNFSSISACSMKRRIIAHPVTTSNSPSVGSGKGKEKEKETKFVESTCVALSGDDFALGFNDGSVFLLKTNDQTFAKRVEVLSSIPIIQMKYCSIKDTTSSSSKKLNRVLFCLTGDRILCEVNLSNNNEITSKVTLSHVESFSIINSSFIMVKNETNNYRDDNVNSINNRNDNNINSINSYPSNANITSVSSKSNIIGNNNSNEEPKTNFLTPYDDDLIYPFPVISKYQKANRVRSKSILQEESSSSIEEKEKENEIEEDSSYSILEKSLSFPVLKELLKQFIVNNPLPDILNEIRASNSNSSNKVWVEESFRKLWFLLLPPIYDSSNKNRYMNYLLTKDEYSRVKKRNLPLGRFGSPTFLPYSTEVGRDFWMLLLDRSSMRHQCLYASGKWALEYEVALSRILEGVATLSAPIKLALNTSPGRHSLSHHHHSTLPAAANNGGGGGGGSSASSMQSTPAAAASSSAGLAASSNSSAAREKKYTMELFYQLVYAHRYDEATNVLAYNPDSDAFMFNTILAAALLGFSEFDVDISSSKGKSSDDLLSSNSSSIPSLKKFDNESSSFSLSMSAREQQYAVIKHAATQMIMLSTVTGRLVEGANLLRLSQLDSYAASILIQAGQVGLAMKFIRGMKTKKRKTATSGAAHMIRFQTATEDEEPSPQNPNVSNNENSLDKSGFCFEIGAKCYKCQYFREASLFFLTADEHFLALLSFFMFAKISFASKSSSHFNIHYAQAICDIFFLKYFLFENGLIVQPLLSEKDELFRKKKLDKLGAPLPFCTVDELVQAIDIEFKDQIHHLSIDDEIFFKSS